VIAHCNASSNLLHSPPARLAKRALMIVTQLPHDFCPSVLKVAGMCAMLADFLKAGIHFD
jgi:hypothetical protein